MVFKLLVLIALLVMSVTLVMLARFFRNFNHEQK